MSPLWWILPILSVNILCFALMGIDKQRSIKKQWRISEKTLMIAAACFGSLGGMAGMLVFRHKTQHARFAVGFPLMLGVQVVALIFLVGLFF